LENYASYDYYTRLLIEADESNKFNPNNHETIGFNYTKVGVDAIKSEFKRNKNQYLKGKNPFQTELKMIDKGLDNLKLFKKDNERFHKIRMDSIKKSEVISNKHFKYINQSVQKQENFNKKYLKKYTSRINQIVNNITKQSKSAEKMYHTPMRKSKNSDPKISIDSVFKIRIKEFEKIEQNLLKIDSASSNLALINSKLDSAIQSIDAENSPSKIKYFENMISIHNKLIINYYTENITDGFYFQVIENKQLLADTIAQKANLYRDASQIPEIKTWKKTQDSLIKNIIAGYDSLRKFTTNYQKFNTFRNYPIDSLNLSVDYRTWNQHLMKFDSLIGDEQVFYNQVSENALDFIYENKFYAWEREHRYLYEKHLWCKEQLENVKNLKSKNQEIENHYKYLIDLKKRREAYRKKVYDLNADQTAKEADFYRKWVQQNAKRKPKVNKQKSLSDFSERL
jgi:hypothetical protein